MTSSLEGVVCYLPARSRTLSICHPSRVHACYRSQAGLFSSSHSYLIVLFAASYSDSIPSSSYSTNFQCTDLPWPFNRLVICATNFTLSRKSLCASSVFAFSCSSLFSSLPACMPLSAFISSNLSFKAASNCSFSRAILFLYGRRSRLAFSPSLCTSFSCFFSWKISILKLVLVSAFFLLVPISSRGTFLRSC